MSTKKQTQSTNAPDKRWKLLNGRHQATLRDESVYAALQRIGYIKPSMQFLDMGGKK